MPEIIRMGDPTSHGGKVLEGSITDICHGKPISFIGHKVSCPKCKGIFPIIEGVQTTTFYGKGVAVAGMKTACGATLIATQFTDTVEWSTGAAGSSTAAAAKKRAAPAAGAATTGASAFESGGTHAKAADHVTGQDLYDEQPQLPVRVADGVPYLIITPDGQKLSGKVDASGKLPRISTDGEADYAVYWGDEALARMQERAT